MTGRWSSQVQKMEFKDLQANALAVDCTGKLALLAGRRALAIVNLTKSTDCPDIKKIPRQSKWEVSAAQWNPHDARANIFITACNQRADIWSWDDQKGASAPQGSLKAHTRVISDVDWSPVDPNLVVTCSGDAYTFLWDVRDTRKPSVSMQAVVGASQVKWNKKNTQLLATAHDGDIRIWDPRKGTSPVQYIAAHLSKIHGLDWSPSSEYHLASSSQDCTVKFWDVNSPKVPEGKLAWSSPVWRARYTPLGDGMATVMVPQLRRGENSLLLWQLSDLRQPVHTFMGHQDVVLEFQWRPLQEDTSDSQLVSWSRDQTLRLWKVETQPDKPADPDVDEISIGVEPDLSADDTATATTSSSATTDAGIAIPTNHRSPKGPAHSVAHRVRDTKEPRLAFTPPQQTGSYLRGPRDEMLSPQQQPKTLHHEFALVSFHIPNVSVLEMNPHERTFLASAHAGSMVVKLLMEFPDSYPNNVQPEFSFQEDTNVDTSTQEQLYKVLNETSLLHVRQARSCIEPCLMKLVDKLRTLATETGDASDTTLAYLSGPTIASSQRYLSMYHQEAVPYPPASVPYPRTCGARFCGAGYLVCFTKQMEAGSANNVRRTSSTADFPSRTMASYGSFSQGSRTPQSGPGRTPQGGGGRTPQGVSGLRNMYSTRSPPAADGILGYHREGGYKDRKPSRPRSKSRVRDTKPKTGPVIIYNVACLMPLNKQLAENYVFDDKDVPAMCNKNASAAEAVGRRDLVQVWSLAALATSQTLKPNPDPDKGPPWAVHAFGRKLLNSLISHYSSINDVQTLAMLCCTFGAKYDPQKPLPAPKFPKSTENLPNYKTYHTIHPSDTSLKGWNFTISNIKRSSSWSNLTNDPVHEEAKDPAQKERAKHDKNMSILDQHRYHEHDQYKRAYADALYRWQLYDTRADVLKYVSNAAEAHKGIEFGAECQHCRKEVRGVQCFHCKNFVLQCVICHMSVRGSSSFCLACGHGGHTAHMTEWFRAHDECPTGCGCECLDDNPMCDSAGGDT